MAADSRLKRAGVSGFNETITSWADAIAAVKTKFPKPN